MGPMANPEVSLTGGSGLVGGHLLTTLVDSGTSVRALVRSSEAAEKVASLGATPIVVDLFDHDGLRDAVWGTSVLYHVAGVNETCPRDPSVMDRVNIEGTRAVIAAATDGGVGRIVYTSSAAAIGESAGMIGTEATRHNGSYLSRYARSKHLAEVAAFEESERLGVDLVAVSPSSVQGPGRSEGSAKILLYALRSNRPLLVDVKVSLVDIEDCTAGHLAAAERGRSGERYLLSGSTSSVSDLIAMAGTEAGIEVRPRWLAEGTVRTIGGVGARVAGMFTSEICPALVTTLLHGHRFDGSRAERDLGIEYTPVEQTIARTIEWFRSEGLV